MGELRAQYKFGVSGLPVSRKELARHLGRVEALGLDFVVAADHLGQAAPFSRLAAAAMFTERLRLRTYVLNACFWNPALLAREAATLDALSGGRFELGLGAGTVRREFEDAGVPWLTHRERVLRLRKTLVVVRQRLEDPGHQPKPIQHPLPLLVGAMSEDG